MEGTADVGVVALVDAVLEGTADVVDEGEADADTVGVFVVSTFADVVSEKIATTPLHRHLLGEKTNTL